MKISSESLDVTLKEALIKSGLFDFLPLLSIESYRIDQYANVMQIDK